MSPNKLDVALLLSTNKPPLEFGLLSPNKLPLGVDLFYPNKVPVLVPEKSPEVAFVWNKVGLFLLYYLFYEGVVSALVPNNELVLLLFKPGKVNFGAYYFFWSLFVGKLPNNPPYLRTVVFN